MHLLAAYSGEFLGTFILVFFGTATVATSVLFQAPVGLVQVALVWGTGVTLAIYATRHLSCAHLNPAVSLGMVLTGRMQFRFFLPYCAAQLCGAAAAGGMVLLLFGPAITGYELAHGIVRGSVASVQTAMLFGEYFPNPGFALPWFKVSMGTAMLTEGFGAFILITMIFLLTEGCNVGRPGDALAPVFIGATVAILIAVMAPFTQVGINPARDLGPRIIAYVAGWEQVAIPGPNRGFFQVYVLSPFLGAAAASVCFRFIVVPFMSAKNRFIACTCFSTDVHIDGIATQPAEGGRTVSPLCSQENRDLR